MWACRLTDWEKYCYIVLETSSSVSLINYIDNDDWDLKRCFKPKLQNDHLVSVIEWFNLYKVHMNDTSDTLYEYVQLVDILLSAFCIVP